HALALAVDRRRYLGRQEVAVGSLAVDPLHGDGGALVAPAERLHDVRRRRPGEGVGVVDGRRCALAHVGQTFDGLHEFVEPIKRFGHWGCSPSWGPLARYNIL